MRALLVVAALFVSVTASALHARTSKPKAAPADSFMTFTESRSPFRPLRVQINGHWYVAYSTIVIQDNAKPVNYETLTVMGLPKHCLFKAVR